MIGRVAVPRDDQPDRRRVPQGQNHVSSATQLPACRQLLSVPGYFAHFQPGTVSCSVKTLYSEPLSGSRFAKKMSRTRRGFVVKNCLDCTAAAAGRDLWLSTKHLVVLHSSTLWLGHAMMRLSVRMGSTHSAFALTTTRPSSTAAQERASHCVCIIYELIINRMRERINWSVRINHTQNMNTAKLNVSGQRRFLSSSDSSNSMQTSQIPVILRTIITIRVITNVNIYYNLSGFNLYCSACSVYVYVDLGLFWFYNTVFNDNKAMQNCKKSCSVTMTVVHGF